MSKYSEEKKLAKLGMPFGTACARLKKNVLFHILKKHVENICYRCNEEIKSPDELTLEHKIAWLNSSVDLFWDINNVAFSHPECNRRAAISPQKGIFSHPSQNSYKNGCRCQDCRNLEAARRRDQRSRGIKT